MSAKQDLAIAQRAVTKLAAIINNPNSEPSVRRIVASAIFQASNQPTLESAANSIRSAIAELEKLP